MLVGLVIIAGLFCLLLLATSQKVGHSGSVGVFFGVIAVPAAISLLWRSAHVFGWWTIALFIGISFVIGFIANAATRSGKLGALVAIQPLTGFIGAVCAVGCWFVR